MKVNSKRSHIYEADSLNFRNAILHQPSHVVREITNAFVRTHYSEMAVVNGDTGLPIQITVKGVRHSLQRKISVTTAYAVPSLPELAEAAKLIRREPFGGNKEEADATLPLQAGAMIGGIQHQVRMIVHEKQGYGALYHFDSHIKKALGFPQ